MSNDNNNTGENSPKEKERNYQWRADEFRLWSPEEILNNRLRKSFESLDHETQNKQPAAATQVLRNSFSDKEKEESETNNDDEQNGKMFHSHFRPPGQEMDVGIFIYKTDQTGDEHSTDSLYYDDGGKYQYNEDEEKREYQNLVSEGNSHQLNREELVRHSYFTVRDLLQDKLVSDIQGNYIVRIAINTIQQLWGIEEILIKTLDSIDVSEFSIPENVPENTNANKVKGFLIFLKVKNQNQIQSIKSLFSNKFKVTDASSKSPSNDRNTTQNNDQSS